MENCATVCCCRRTRSFTVLFVSLKLENSLIDHAKASDGSSTFYQKMHVASYAAVCNLRRCRLQKQQHQKQAGASVASAAATAADAAETVARFISIDHRPRPTAFAAFPPGTLPPLPGMLPSLAAAVALHGIPFAFPAYRRRKLVVRKQCGADWLRARL